MGGSLLAETIYALGPKRSAQALGYSLGYCYALARDTADPEHPDNTGVEVAPWDRHVTLMEAVSTYPHLRPLLHRWRLQSDALFDRLLDHKEAVPVPHATLQLWAGAYAEDAGQTVNECIKEGDDEAALREALQDLEHLKRIIAALHARIEADTVTPMHRPRAS